MNSSSRRRTADAFLRVDNDDFFPAVAGVADAIEFSSVDNRGFPDLESMKTRTLCVVAHFAATQCTAMAKADQVHTIVCFDSAILKAISTMDHLLRHHSTVFKNAPAMSNASC